MKKLLTLTAAGAVGYVLGTRAGRERYDQIRRVARDVKDDPRVQAQAHKAADLAREKAPLVKEKVATATGAHAAHPSDLEAQLNPDNVALQDDPYPQGKLP